jgi:hypothetical protein
MAAHSPVWMVALVFFFRRFGQDTPDTRLRAARTMPVVYAVIGLLGASFLILGLAASPMQVRTVVQALIFLGLGAGWKVVNRRSLKELN